MTYVSHEELASGVKLLIDNGISWLTTNKSEKKTIVELDMFNQLQLPRQLYVASIPFIGGDPFVLM